MGVFGDSSGVEVGIDHGGQVGEGWCRCDKSILVEKHFPYQRRLNRGWRGWLRLHRFGRLSYTKFNYTIYIAYRVPCVFEEGKGRGQTHRESLRYNV